MPDELNLDIQQKGVVKMNTCIYCGKKLPASNTQKNSAAKTRSLEIGHIDPDMMFCTLRCAAKYGVMIAREAYPDRVKVPNVEFSGGAPLFGAASAGTQG